MAGQNDPDLLNRVLERMSANSWLHIEGEGLVLNPSPSPMRGDLSPNFQRLSDLQPAEKVDLLTTRHVVAHATEPADLVKRYSTRVEPGGFWIMIERSVMPFAETQQQFDAFIQSFEKNHLQTVPIADLVELVEGHGFHVLELEEEQHSVPVVELGKSLGMDDPAIDQLIVQVKQFSKKLEAQFNVRWEGGCPTLQFSDCAIVAQRQAT